LEPETKRLYQAFLVLRDPDEVRKFLADLLSERELQSLEARWQAWELLTQGLTQTKVSEQTDLSRVTVGRADRVLNNGKGMIRVALQRLNSRLNVNQCQ